MAQKRSSSARQETGTEALPPDEAGHELVQRLRLTVAEGEDAGRSFASTAERTTVGTHRSADLVLADRTVSRFHCEIGWSDGKPRVRDLGSRNGTFVDGVQVVDGYLREGSVLTLGRTQLRFELGDDHVAIPLSDRTELGTLVGRSRAMRAVFAQLERAASSDATVLLEGETGTGKEAAAETIHQQGERREGPFIVLDCSALPRNLLESELFGHQQGAFTGATSPRQGAFEAADGGTVFLDEIGELDLDLQPKLLRVLERREVKRLGQTKYNPVDVRVIAATHRNLQELVNAREFRSDLYYRLAVIPIRLPPLRERREDLPLLVDRMVERLEVPADEAAPIRSEEFASELQRHTWPGNVRELRNYIERCLVLQQTMPLPERNKDAAADEPAMDLDRPLKEARERWTRTFEQRYLQQLLHRHADNVSAAARAAEVDRIYLYRLLWKHGLR